MLEPSEMKSVLHRASELQAKLDIAISRAEEEEEGEEEQEQVEEEDASDEKEDGHAHGDEASFSQSKAQNNGKGNNKQKLGAIRHALLDLHRCLHSLQDLQKRQKSERENLLVDLEERRNTLIQRLGEYNGAEWEIIEEAQTFVGVPVQRKDDLVLPPYQVPIGHILTFGDSSSPQRSASTKRVSLVSTVQDNDANDDDDDDNDDDDDDDDDQMGKPYNKDSETKAGSRNFLGFPVTLFSLASRAAKVVSFSSKTLLVLSGIITVFAVSLSEPRFRKWSRERISKKMKSSGENLNKDVSPRPLVQNKEVCPPGKVLLVRDGVEKCFVKERIEAPFKEVVKQPDASYGYG